jgi:serine/threonine-protein kinase
VAASRTSPRPAVSGDTRAYAPPAARASGDALGTRDAPPPSPPRRAGVTLVWRIFLAAAAAVFVILAAVIGTLAVFARRSADEALAHALADARGHVTTILDGRIRALTSGAAVFAQDPKFKALLLDSARSPADLLDRAGEAAQRIGATWVQITDADGIRLAKSDEPSAPNASLAETSLVGGALGGEVTTGAGVIGDTAAIEGAAVPVELDARGSRVIGVLLAARALDAAVAREMKRATESEVVVYYLDGAGRARVAASTLSPASRSVALDAVRRQRARRDSLAPFEVRLDGTVFVGQVTALRSATDDVVGGVLTLRSRDRELAPFIALRRRILLVGLVGLLLAFAVAYAVARQITRPILALRDVARRVAAGDLAGSDVRIESSGEVGELADAVRLAFDHVHDCQALAGLVERARTTPAAVPAPDAASTAMLAPHSTLAGRYEIEAVLGVGGNGVVYRAIDLELGETVAIKTLRADTLAVGPVALERLKDEIRLARRIGHGGVVRIHDLGEADGLYFVTMEHVAGLPLAEVLQRLGRLTPAQVVALGKQLCDALGAAHAQGVIHRDVKPQNLMLQPDGTLKVLDFGVARLAERAAGLTLTGAVVGTPAYMAPEQLLAESIDARVDVYAAGAVLYEALTGHRPYEASSPPAIIARILSGEAPAPAAADPSIPRTLSDVVVRALAHEPAGRPASAAELRDLLVRAAVEG